MDTNEATPGFEVAQAVLRALSATVPIGQRAEGFVLLPQAEPISLHALATRLANEAKPITCVAMPRGAAIAIGWWTMAAEEAADHREFMSNMLADLETPRTNRDVRDPGAPTSPAHSILLSYGGLEAFFCDYHLPFAEFSIRRLQQQSRTDKQLIEVDVTPASFASISGGPIS